MSTLTVKELAAPTGYDLKIAAGETLDLKSQGTVTMPTGSVLQMVSIQDTASSTGTGTMTNDAAIPQITGGTEFMTLSITPKSATSKLLIQLVGFLDAADVYYGVTALFVGTTSDALAAEGWTNNHVSYPQSTTLTHVMTSGVTTELTFRIRAGTTSGSTTTWSGRSGGNLFGACPKSSLTITEIAG